MAQAHTIGLVPAKAAAFAPASSVMAALQNVASGGQVVSAPRPSDSVRKAKRGKSSKSTTITATAASTTTIATKKRNKVKQPRQQADVKLQPTSSSAPHCHRSRRKLVKFHLLEALGATCLGVDHQPAQGIKHSTPFTLKKASVSIKEVSRAPARAPRKCQGQGKVKPMSRGTDTRQPLNHDGSAQTKEKRQRRRSPILQVGWSAVRKAQHKRPRIRTMAIVEQRRALVRANLTGAITKLKPASLHPSLPPPSPPPSPPLPQVKGRLSPAERKRAKQQAAFNRHVAVFGKQRVERAEQSARDKALYALRREAKHSTLIVDANTGFSTDLSATAPCPPNALTPPPHSFSRHARCRMQAQLSPSVITHVLTSLHQKTCKSPPIPPTKPFSPQKLRRRMLLSSLAVRNIQEHEVEAALRYWFHYQRVQGGTQRSFSLKRQTLGGCERVEHDGLVVIVKKVPDTVNHKALSHYLIVTTFRSRQSAPLENEEKEELQEQQLQQQHLANEAAILKLTCHTMTKAHAFTATADDDLAVSALHEVVDEDLETNEDQDELRAVQPGMVDADRLNAPTSAAVCTSIRLQPRHRSFMTKLANLLEAHTRDKKNPMRITLTHSPPRSSRYHGPMLRCAARPMASCLVKRVLTARVRQRQAERERHRRTKYACMTFAPWQTLTPGHQRGKQKHVRRTSAARSKLFPGFRTVCLVKPYSTPPLSRRQTKTTTAKKQKTMNRQQPAGRKLRKQQQKQLAKQQQVLQVKKQQSERRHQSTLPQAQSEACNTSPRNASQYQPRVRRNPSCPAPAATPASSVLSLPVYSPSHSLSCMSASNMAQTGAAPQIQPLQKQQPKGERNKQRQK